MSARLWRALAAAVLSVTCTTACGMKPLITLPTGQVTPAPDGEDALGQATAACVAVRSMTAEMRLSGRIGGRRARSRLLVGVTAPASAYIEAPAPFGASAFVFAAVDDVATLLLPRDRRMLERGHPSDVLEAIAGVALTPRELRDTLTGCVTGVDGRAARQAGERWRVIFGEPRVYLRRARPSEPWHVAAVVHRENGRAEWRAEYADAVDRLPRTIRLTSAEPSRFDVALALSQVELNVPLGDEVFHPVVPAGYQPVTLDQLRASGPLAESSHR